MATVIIKLSSKIREKEYFLMDCTNKVEALLRRSKNSSTSASGYSLFITILCQTLPSFDSLTTRKQAVEAAFKVLEKSKYFNLEEGVIAKARSCSESFFKSPYGVMKFTRDPKSILDLSASFRITTITIQNELDLETFDQLIGL